MYSVFDKFVYRIPVLPANDSFGIIPGNIEQLTANDFYKDVLYMSSPDLYNFSSSNNKKDKHQFALLKYYLRSKYRCTPFGLMAGVGTGNIVDGSSAIQLASADRYTRKTRLDMNYICSLLQEVAKETYIKRYLRYFPNNSIYSSSGKLRYVEYIYQNNQRTHILTGVENNHFISAILELAASGAYIDELVEAIDDDGIEPEEKLEFVNELIAAQLLVSELEPCVTGEEMDVQIIKTLQTLAARSVSQEDTMRIESLAEKLNAIRAILAEVDANGISGNNIDAYLKIEEILKTINVPFEKKYLFQTDMVTKAATAVLEKKITEQVIDAVEAVSRLSPQIAKTNLDKFKDAFYERWEDKEVPLVIALDAEQGIGYIQSSSESNDINPLVDDLALPFNIPDKQTYEFNSRLFQFWLTKFTAALKNDDYEIALQPEDLRNFPAKTEQLPNTFSVMLSVVGAAQILVKSIGGSTSANLLGRFCHIDKGIDELAKEMIVKDEQFFDNRIVAEICHLPESRTGNILFRPAFRNYEIPYLAKSSLDAEQQVPVSDLMISIRQNRIFLRSAKFNKEVIPRLTTAHNYSYKSLPVYHFLSDMQTQDRLGGVEVDLGLAISNSTFVPRITFKGSTILQPARWQFRKSDFVHLVSLKEHELQTAFAAFKKQWKLPDVILLTEADNELVIDTRDNYSLQLLLSEIKSKDFVTITEFLFDTDSPLVKGGNGIYSNEIILSYYRERKEQAGEYNRMPANAVEAGVKRIFNPGDEWLYFKIYTGFKTADELLTTKIKPLCDHLVQRGLVAKWFFIRYADPRFHIRFRVLLNDTRSCGEIICLINETLKPYIDAERISKLQIDTYTREVERYGVFDINNAETIFYRDSESVLSILEMLEGIEGENIRWLATMRSVDEYLETFLFSLEEKKNYIASLRDYFASEFNADKDFKSQLDKKFRRNKETIENWLARPFGGTSAEMDDYIPVIEAIERRTEHLSSLVSQLVANTGTGVIRSGLSSLLHMNINRMFRAKNRLHEYVIYDLLERHYRYQSGRINALKTKSINEKVPHIQTA